MSKNALDGKRMNMFGYDPDEFTIIGIDTDDGPEHTLYDVTFRHEIDEGMVLNIMELGVLDPVIVTKEPDDSERGYRILVVNGRRRVIHAREAKKRMARLGEPGSVCVPVVLKKGSDNLLEKVSLATNFVRMDDTTMGKADRAVKMLYRNGGDYAEVAIAIGATVKTVQTYEKLMGLSTKVRKAVDAGYLSATAASKLSDLSKADQDSELAKLLEASGGKRVSTSQAKSAAAKKNGKAESTAPKKRTLKKLVEYYEEMEETEEPELPFGFIQGVKFALGMVGSDDVDGLGDALHALE